MKSPKPKARRTPLPDLSTALAFAQLELVELKAGKRALTQCPGIKAVAELIAAAELGAT